MIIAARPVAECTSAQVAEALTRSFEGYLVPIQFTPQAYERRFRFEDLDPYASRVYEREGRLLDLGIRRPAHTPSAPPAPAPAPRSDRNVFRAPAPRPGAGATCPFLYK